MKVIDTLSLERKVCVVPPANVHDVQFPGVERLEYPARRCCAALHVISGLTAALVVWSAVARIDLVAQSPGTLIPRGDVKTIQPPSDGTILKIFAKEGQHVRQGDRLALMDRVPLAADVQRTQHELKLCKSERSRHLSAAEALNAAVENPGKFPDAEYDTATVGSEISELYSAYKKLQEDKLDFTEKSSAIGMDSDRINLKAKLDRLSEQRKSLESFIKHKKIEFATKERATQEYVEELKRQVAQAKAARQKLMDSVAKTKEQVRCFEAIYNGGAISRVALLDASKRLDEAEQAVLQTDARISSEENRVSQNQLSLIEVKAASLAAIRQSEAEVERINIDMSNTKLQFRDIERKLNLSRANFQAALARTRAAFQQETDALADCDNRIKVLEVALGSSKHTYDIAEIHAPVDGTVTAIKITTDGQVVARGEGLMTIVPSHAGYLVEAHVANRDFGFIQLNQTAKIKLDAFPYQDYGIIHGKVVEIESQPQQDKDIGSYFNVRIEPSRDWVVARGRNISLTNGMTAQTEIVIRNKTVLELVLEPFAKLTDVSLKH